MANPIADISLRKAALIAGLAYLIDLVIAVTADFWAPFVQRGDAATFANAVANDLLFSIGMAGWVIVLVADLVVAWALYVFLKPVNKSLSLLAALFRVVFVALYGVSLLIFFLASQLSSGAYYLSVFGTDLLQAQVMLFLSVVDFGVVISFVFFGLHIFLLGYLILKSSYVPRILGVVLIVAGIGYQIASFANIVLPNFAYIETLGIITLLVPALISEVSLTLWLLLRGRKIPKVNL